MEHHKEFDRECPLDRNFTMEMLENVDDKENGILLFQQSHPWSVRYGPTTLLHVSVFTRACYSHIRLPEKLSRWDGDELELEGVSKYGVLTTYSQYSKHLDQIPIENRKIDFCDKEFDLETRTYKYRINPDCYELNKIPYMALRPDYVDRSKRVIFL